MRSSVTTHDDPKVQDPAAPVRGPEHLDPRGVLALQR